MNKLNDELNFIEWNKEEGHKFDTLEEMKDFEIKLENGDFDFLFAKIEELDKKTLNNAILEYYISILENIYFYVYVLKKHDKYITYLALKSNEDTDVLDKLCEKQYDDRKKAHMYFETLKMEISSNAIENILQLIIDGVEQTIISLKNKLELLTNES